MDEQPWREEFHGPGLRATARCNGNRCLVEVWVEQTQYPQAERVRLEVLLQPRDQRGLPRGSPALLHEMQFSLRRRPDGETLGSHAWLPSEMGAALVSRCHFRITPC